MTHSRMSPFGLLRKAWSPLLLLLAAAPAVAADGVRVLETRIVAGEAPAAEKIVTHDLRLELYTFRGSHWGAGDAVVVAWGGAEVLAQCGVAFGGGELRVLDTPERFHDYSPTVARELARAMTFRKPAVFFIEKMRDQPTHASESIVRADSRERPELADTVWLAHGD